MAGWEMKGEDRSGKHSAPPTLRRRVCCINRYRTLPSDQPVFAFISGRMTPLVLPLRLQLDRGCQRRLNRTSTTTSATSAPRRRPDAFHASTRCSVFGGVYSRFNGPVPPSSVLDKVLSWWSVSCLRHIPRWRAAAA